VNEIAWQVIIAVVVAFFGGVVLRSAGLRASTSLYRESNSELRDELAYKNDLVERQHRECEAKIQQLRIDHEREMGEVRGQLVTLRTVFLEGIATAVETGIIKAANRDPDG
jgi:hypothetical protein